MINFADETVADMFHVNPNHPAMNEKRGIMTRIAAALKGVVRFYIDGFRSMTIGRTLWVIILVKLAIFFGVLKLFFFPDLLARDYDNDQDRADHVRRELIDR